jgi:glycosyltransferase involved in cell wall biosynthesis/tetratricopeptide (TPR) repeat protein
MDKALARRLLTEDPAHAVALQHLAVAATNEGDGLRAIRLFVRAYRLHGNVQALEDQIAHVLPTALNQISRLLDLDLLDEAVGRLEWLSGLIAPTGHLARLLGIVRLVQGRDAEAAELHVQSGLGDTGLGTALAAIAAHRDRYDFIGTVVIPAFNMADSIERSLDSVAASIAWYRSAAQRPMAKVHISVVDDCSTDETVAVVLRWARANPEQSVALTANNQNRGAGRSRNAGATGAFGPYLWFLDADDTYLPPHLFATASFLDRHPEFAYVRTNIYFEGIDAEISQVWRTASVNSYPCNLCLRRECHDQIGGFPEEAPFHPACADDVAYSRALSAQYSGATLDVKTVHYSMRTGNVLSKLQSEMVSGRPPGENAVVDSRFMAIEILIRRRIYALNAGERAPWLGAPWTGAPWTSAPRQSSVADAGSTARSTTPPAPDSTQGGAATPPADASTWFALGLDAHRQGRNDDARKAYKAACDLAPQMMAARINLGLLLLEEGDYVTAEGQLRAAVEQQPKNAKAVFLLGRSLRPLGKTAEADSLLTTALRLAPDNAAHRAEYAACRLDQGDHAGALASALLSLSLDPAHHDAFTTIAAVRESQGDIESALIAWDRAILCNNGYGTAFTRRALLLLSAQWGPPPRPTMAAGTRRRLAASRIGSNGRFGNQLLQYGVTRLFAETHGLTLEVPLWLGRHLYDLDDPLPGPALPRLSEAKADLMGAISAPGTDLADHDIDGYFCGDVSGLAPLAERFRRLFTPGRHLRAYAAAVEATLRSSGGTLVALHLRRGDFGWGPFWTAPEDWYLEWLRQVWPTLDRPVLYVATDDPGCLVPFAAFCPLTARNLPDPIPGAEFFGDFHALCMADWVAISNSTFSYVATMLNRAGKGFVRPDRSQQALVSYSPWASAVLI